MWLDLCKTALGVFLLTHAPLFLVSSFSSSFPLQLLSVSTLQGSSLDYLTGESVHFPMDSKPTLPIYMFIPWLSPEIQASMCRFLVNFSNSRSHAYLIFIQNRLPNSHSLPQSVPFLRITIHMAVQDRITWFSLLPFHGPCGPSYQQTLPSLPLSDVSSPTTLSLSPHHPSHSSVLPMPPQELPKSPC